MTPKIPKDWRRLRDYSLPKVGDRCYVPTVGWCTLSKNMGLHPVDFGEVIIRRAAKKKS
jgi:hypothetical protein